MTQTRCNRANNGTQVKYTPVADVIAGQVVVVGGIPMIAPYAIAAGVEGVLEPDGGWDVPAATGAWTQGDAIYWDDNGDPITGDAGSGAFTTTASGNYLAGYAAKDKASGDAYGKLNLTSAKRTTTIAGSVTADDLTGSDSSLAIAGLSATQGGAVTLAGGPSTGGNNNGGALTLKAGAKNGSGADGVLTIGATDTSAINIGAAAIVTRNVGHSQKNGNAAVTATTGGGTTGLIPAGASFVTVTSDSADKQISLPAATVGDEIEILVGSTACELISAVAAHKVNEVTVGATNELALTADALYRCKYTKTNYWIVTGETKLGARISALVPDTL